jgi:DNA repair protein RecN (Recombination protein N)
MLFHLSISNYALIDSAEIEFDRGFTVITGETGAGKSIMLGALALILGQRADTSVIRDKERKCVVEAGFDIADYGLEELFKTEDVDFDTKTYIRREILPEGKSRAFVNDTPVTLQFLKNLCERLIDIHSQHQNLLLGDFKFQLAVVDNVAANEAERAAYRQEYHNYRHLQKERDKLIKLNEKQSSDRDYWDFQVQQLSEARLVDREQEELEKELEQLIHIEEIRSALTLADGLLSSGESPVNDRLYMVQTEIEKIESWLTGGRELAERLRSVLIELRDITSGLSRIAADLEFDPQRLSFVRDRLDLIYSLQQKHKVGSVGELIAILNELQDKLNALDAFDEEIEKLDYKIAESKSRLDKAADVLAQSRRGVFETLEKHIVSNLAELGMPNARFLVDCREADDYREDGRDVIQFLFSANKNGELCEIPKVASGGEMSRLMLCIKALLSTAKGLATIIFDEIDTGVSGEIADRMGRIMKEMGRNIQVISITHLPQIAAKGISHLKVSKRDTDKLTVSEIKKLNSEERVLEIAGMLSGSELSEAALINARDLMS